MDTTSDRYDTEDVHIHVQTEPKKPIFFQQVTVPCYFNIIVRSKKHEWKRDFYEKTKSDKRNTRNK